MHNFDLLLVLLHVSESEVTLTSSDTEDHIFLCFALVHNLQLVICLVVSANALSIGKVGFSATSGSKIPEGIATKLGVSNYVGDPTSTSKYGSEGSAWGVSPYVWNITVCDFPFCFFPSFRFFISPTGCQGWLIFTIYTSNGAFSHKEVPFGGLDDKFSHIHLYPQNMKIGITAYGDFKRR